MNTAETIQTATWTPSPSAQQRGAKKQQLFVFPDRISGQAESGYIVVSKQPEGKYVFSVKREELA